MSLSNIVHGLWIRGPLSAMEMLTIHSYLSNGYVFKLWVYDDPAIYVLPEGATVLDAREVIPEEQVFCYKFSNQFGHGKGSYAGFSDIFRYKLLLDQGGWWTDMDVSCLRRLNFPGEYVFRYSKESDSGVVGNLMHVPAGSELMLRCYEQAVATIDADNRDWMAPINILNNHIRALGLENNIYAFTNPDSWPVVSRLVVSPVPPDPNWMAIHWMNEEFRRLKISKECYIPHSYLGHLMQQFGLGKPLNDRLKFWTYRTRASLIYYSFLNINKEMILDSLSSPTNLRQRLYYIGYNIFYFISDLYFVHTKPHFDIGKMLRKLMRFFIPGTKEIAGPPPAKFIKDEALSAVLDDVGFVRLPLLDEGAVEGLRSYYNNLHSPFEKGFHPTMMWSDPALKSAVSAEICSALQPYVDKHMQGYRLLYGNFMVKQPGTESAMKLHQDWTYVDESQLDSYAIWFPLDDLTTENGALYMVPYSHRVKNYQRGPGVFCPFFENNDLITGKYGVPLYLKRGEPVVWQHRTLHYSPANMAQTPRVAVTAILVPDHATVFHYFKEEDSREVEQYAVQDGFYFNYEIGKRPVKHVTLAGKHVYDFPTVPKDKLERILSGRS